VVASSSRAHPLAELSIGDKRPPLEPEPEHLQLGNTEASPELCGSGAELAGGRGVLLDRHRDRALVEGEPAVVGGRLKPVEQTTRTLQPAAGDGGLAAEGKRIGCEPRRHPSR
jgi:hypothetical protein